MTSVESDFEGESATPSEFLLAPNYPNPFNTSTVIRFSVPEASGSVRLTIYNLLGRKIRTLVSGALETGEYSVVWDSKDDLGQSVSSGVYSYQMTVEGRRWKEARRMVLIR